METDCFDVCRLVHQSLEMVVTVLCLPNAVIGLDMEMDSSPLVDKGCHDNTASKQPQQNMSPVCQRCNWLQAISINTEMMCNQT